ncbi:hypothetical protein G6F54_013921 [Rhizopus delemar]|nr:hypothetical protein G6F54_013921 [Rhizopus delemar]
MAEPVPTTASSAWFAADTERRARALLASIRCSAAAAIGAGGAAGAGAASIATGADSIAASADATSSALPFNCGGASFGQLRLHHCWRSFQRSATSSRRRRSAAARSRTWRAKRASYSARSVPAGRIA